MEAARRKALQASVAALCVEIGYIGIEKDALGVLTDTLQTYITNVGRNARVYAELALRTEPTASDVQLALIDAGSDLNAIPDYSKRAQRRHLPRQLRSCAQLQPRCLQVGTKPSRPTNVPAHLPSFPDPHTYIRTPTFAHPVSDYKTVREKLAVQKRNARRGLSKLLAKVRPSQPIAGESDPYGIYTVVRSPAPVMPLYLQALMPSPEDQVDTVVNEKTANGEDSPERGQSDSTSQEGVSKSKYRIADEEDSMGDDTSRAGDWQSVATSSSETYENPFMKPAKRMKLRQL